MIDVNGFGLNFTTLQPYMADVGGNCVITLDAATVLSVIGVTKAQFLANFADEGGRHAYQVGDLFIGACASARKPGGGANANPEFKLRFGSYAPEGDVIDRAAHHFKEGVARLTNGRVEVTVFRSNSLGSNREMIEMTKLGSLDFTVSGSTQSAVSRRC